MDNRIGELPEELGPMVCDAIEACAERPCAIVILILPADVDNPQPTIMTNVEPPIAESIVKQIGEGMTPEVLATRKIIHGGDEQKAH